MLVSTDTQPHPDALTNYAKMKEISRGGNQAIEDRAIKAYHNAIEQGKSKDEASKQYFETFIPNNNGK